MNIRPSRGADRLAAIFDALPDGLVLVNSNGTIVNANTMALGMFEMPGTVLVGRGLFDMLPDFDPRLLPGSMPLPGDAGGQGRTAPARMVARRADGNEFAAEVTGVHLDDRRETPDPYDGHSDDRLLLLVVRDLAGTLDAETELGRSQRQLEMILRAASEGVVGTDAEGRVVLVNPAAAQILGYRASQLGGQQLHPLILHSRADGEPFPYEESPLSDTLGSGRKHRVREQVLWAQDGERIPVDITTAPVRDGSQLVGAVMTFTDQRPYEQLTQKHEAQLADLTERHNTELDRREERYAALDARHAQLEAVLDGALHGSLERLRTELGTLAADDAFHLWPEANQLLQHLSAGYARMTALVNNVLGYQRLDAGTDGLRRKAVLLDQVVDDGIDGAVELIGPGRLRFSVDTPPIEAEIDPERLATALAHLVADVACIDDDMGAAGVDPTIVVVAAQRGDTVRIEVRGPHIGGDPVHQPIVRGIVAAHGGVVRTREVRETGGTAYVLEVPVVADRRTTTSQPSPDARHALPVPRPSAEVPDTGGSGRRRARRPAVDMIPRSSTAPSRNGSGPTGRRRGRPAEGVVVTASEGAKKHAAPGDAVHLHGARGGAPAPMHAGVLTIEADDDGFPAPLSAGDGRHVLVAAQEWPATAEAVPWARFGTAPARTEGVPELMPAPSEWPEPPPPAPAQSLPGGVTLYPVPDVPDASVKEFGQGPAFPSRTPAGA
ncbi:PAS domain-containing protein [Streptomyces sp. NPDC048685]|uniref:PAS domain-containing protein n=1 Tax=Streptomyces sp. NPDC048685 TaxID=3365584 RepID=UPI00371F28BE